MTTFFLVTFRPILMLSKCKRSIDISHTMEPTRLLVRNMNSRLLTFLEIVRLTVLLILTYLCWQNFNSVIHILQVIDVIQFWIIIIVARLSTIWTTMYLFLIFIRELLNETLYSFICFNCKYVIKRCYS